MNITLDVVRHVLKESLGFNSFTASFITRIEVDSKHPTAGITKDGLLVYNPQFVDRYVTCKEDLFSLIFHELLHPLFGHFIYGCGRLENIAADAIINAFISCVYANESRTGNLFRSFYDDKGLMGILRPYSGMQTSRYDKIYGMLYRNSGSRSELSTGELIQTLRILVPKEQVTTVLLLGSHANHSGSQAADGIPQETLSRIADDLQRSLKAKTGQGAGSYANLVKLVMEAVRTQLSIKRQLLQRFATHRKLDRFKQLCHKQRITTSPVPIHPSKRDMVLLASGVFPGMYRNRMQHLYTQNKGLAIYLDVSGSVNAYLPKILGILQHLKQEITSIFVFSNHVVETSFHDVQKGKLQTSFGTDFDCIAESILQRGFDKAVIITDGFASMKENHKQQLLKQGVQTLTVLFSNQHSCETFARFGDVVRLDEVCTQ